MTWWQAASGGHWQRRAQASPNHPCGQAAGRHGWGGEPRASTGLEGSRVTGHPWCWQGWGLTTVTARAPPSRGAEAGPGDVVAGGAPPAGTALLTVSPERALGTGCRMTEVLGPRARAARTQPGPTGRLTASLHRPSPAHSRLWHVSPVQPAGHRQWPLCGSQRPPWRHPQLCWHPAPKRPGRHSAGQYR